MRQPAVRVALIVSLGIVAAATAAFVCCNYRGLQSSLERRVAAGFEVDREAARGAELDAQRERVKQLIDAKSRIAAEVAAGRVSLAEAASSFRKLNAAHFRPDQYAQIRAGASEEEQSCREVISFVEGAVPPDEAAAVLSRLEVERRAYLWRLSPQSKPRSDKKPPRP